MNTHAWPSVTLGDSLVARFAKASGDVNPLHVDATYSRTTPYGRPVVHGALGAFAILGQLPSRWLVGAMDIRIRFRQAIFPNTRYSIRINESENEIEAILHRGEMEMISMVVKPRVLGAANVFDKCMTNGKLDDNIHPLSDTPRLLTHDNINEVGTETGCYRPDCIELQNLCDKVDGAAIPKHWLTALAWASYWTGMRTPGRDALLASIRLRVEPGGKSGFTEKDSRYMVADPTFDRRTGSCQLNAQLEDSTGKAEIAIDSILRRKVPQVTSESLKRYIEPTAKLNHRRIMVVGGTRGLGRGLTLALAQQGAQVLVVHREHSRGRLAEIRKDLGPHGTRLLSLCCDATNAQDLTEALGDSLTLDGMILAPTPPIPSLPLGTSTTAPALNFVEQSLQLAWNPLAVCTERLADGASIVMLSSSAVEDPPALWPHYVAAKMALEGLAQYCARQGRWRVTIARSPRLWTELTNSATGPIGTVPIEFVAKQIVEHMISDIEDRHRDPRSHKATVLTADQLSPTRDAATKSEIGLGMLNAE